jgi:hypothetical protein
MTMPATTPEAITGRAESLGRDAGHAAASWAIDGNTDRATCARILAGITDGDPAVMDAYRVPGLSGEFADEYTPRDLAGELGLDPGDADDADAMRTVCDAWEAGASEAFWHELERLARAGCADPDDPDNAWYPGEADSSFGPMS